MTTKSKRFPVAIVGGGASGSILAAQLARRGICSLLLDGSGRMGRGVAYSTTEPAHLLNVRAEGMSALAGEPDHFADYFAREANGDRRDFAQRRLFARYLTGILQGAVDGGSTTLTEANVVGGSRNGSWTLRLADGSEVEADAVVLAVGNQEPEALAAFDDAGERFVRNPWGEAAQAAVSELAEHGGSALLVGTGLTMVDLVLSLDAAGHNGRILALSRRGLVPRGHADFEPAAIDRDALPKGLRPLARWLRRRSAQVGWRAAIDSLRPHSHLLWQGLTTVEQHRFLRHARPWWDVHRHRIAPQVASTVAGMVAQGRLEIVSARILGVRGTTEGLEVKYRRRGDEEVSKEAFARVFNCTGPLHSMARTRDPLLRSLLDSGEVRADHLGIGLEVDEYCRAGVNLWALGPLTKARYWEIIAVPDIREQAAMVAEDIKRELGA